MVPLGELDRIWIFNSCLLKVERALPVPYTPTRLQGYLRTRQERSGMLRTLYLRELAHFSEHGHLSHEMPQPSAGRFCLSVLALMVPALLIVMPVRSLRRFVRDRRREGAVDSDRAFDQGTQRILLSWTAYLPARDQERVRAHLWEQCTELEQAGCSRRRIRRQIAWEVILALPLWRFVAAGCLLRWLS